MNPSPSYTPPRVRSPRQWIVGAIIVTVFLIITLIVALQGSVRTREHIAENFSRLSEIQNGRITLEELQRLQSDEENAARGFALTRNPFYHDQYENAISHFAQADATLHAILQRGGMTSTTALMDDYDASQQSWRNDVAMPLIERGQVVALNIDKRNKTFADYENKVAARVRSDLDERSRQLASDTFDTINRGALTRIAWLLAFGFLAIFLNVFQFRLNYNLEEERSITHILQRAFRSLHTELPHCEVGSAYVSASSNAAVGGDLFDVYRLADNRALLLIADVSGKGVDAAVLTAFIKFTIRGLAINCADPGTIMTEFNRSFQQSITDPSLFATIFAGILNTDTMVLEYVSAGHDAVFWRSSESVEQLSTTGTVVGILDIPYETKVLQLRDGDTLVLATDGFTEARNRKGALLGEEGAKTLIARVSPEPQLLADEIVATIKARSGNHMRDDVAILAVRVHPA